MPVDIPVCQGEEDLHIDHFSEKEKPPPKKTAFYAKKWVKYLDTSQAVSNQLSVYGRLAEGFC
ncbi:MAG: hypothetical protein NTX42_12765 [Methanothrix sp.]|nr:hypothetical protein [Methanothrix sp.]